MNTAKIKVGQLVSLPGSKRSLECVEVGSMNDVYLKGERGGVVALFGFPEDGVLRGNYVKMVKGWGSRAPRDCGVLKGWTCE